MNDQVRVKELHFHGNRMENRLHTVEESLKLAISMLETGKEHETRENKEKTCSKS